MAKRRRVPAVARHGGQAGIREADRRTPKRRLAEAVVAVAEEREEAEVAEDLELLADFGADVAIGGKAR